MTGQWSEALEAHAASSNNPAINDPDDWIPDYPPQSTSDDSQDYDPRDEGGYPEEDGESDQEANDTIS